MINNTGYLSRLILLRAISCYLSLIKKYDIVIGNPPYMKLTKEKSLATKYKAGAINKDTNISLLSLLKKP